MIRRPQRWRGLELRAHPPHVHRLELGAAEQNQIQPPDKRYRRIGEQWIMPPGQSWVSRMHHAPGVGETVPEQIVSRGAVMAVGVGFLLLSVLSAMFAITANIAR